MLLLIFLLQAETPPAKLIANAEAWCHEKCFNFSVSLQTWPRLSTSQSLLCWARCPGPATRSPTSFTSSTGQRSAKFTFLAIPQNDFVCVFHLNPLPLAGFYFLWFSGNWDSTFGPKIVRCYCTKSKELITLASAVLPVLPGALICLKKAVWGKEILFYHFLHYFDLILQVCHQRGVVSCLKLRVNLILTWQFYILFIFSMANFVSSCNATSSPPPTRRRWATKSWSSPEVLQGLRCCSDLKALQARCSFAGSGLDFTQRVEDVF